MGVLNWFLVALLVPLTPHHRTIQPGRTRNGHESVVGVGYLFGLDYCLVAPIGECVFDDRRRLDKEGRRGMRDGRDRCFAVTIRLKSVLQKGGGISMVKILNGDGGGKKVWGF